MSAAEEWRPVPGYEGLYDVSSFGRIRSHHRRGCIRKLGRDEWGYPATVFYKPGAKPWPATIHRIVCRVFNGEPGPGDEAAHLDGDRTNVRADNLAWASKVENEAHKLLHGTRHKGEASPCSKYAEKQVRTLKRLLAAGLGCTAAARIAGINYGSAHAMERGKSWQHITV